MSVKSVLVILTTILVCLPAAAGAIRLEEAWQKSFAVGPNPRLELENVNGDIRVVIGEGGSIEVRAQIRIKAPSKSMARDLYEGIEFATAMDGDRVSVKTVLPRVYLDAFPGMTFGERPAIRVRYQVAVPRGTELAVSTVNGDIVVAVPEGALAKVEAHSVHGRISTK